MDLDFPDFDRGRSYRRSRRSASGTWRRRHRHLFAWVVLAGGAVLLALAVFAGLAALGLGGVISSAYFGLAEMILPTSWHDELHALPGIAHVAIAIITIAVIVGIAGELFD